MASCKGRSCFLFSIETKEKQVLERFLSFLEEDQNLNVDCFPVEESLDYFCFVLCLDDKKSLPELWEWQEEFNRKLCEEGVVDRLSSLAPACCWNNQDKVTLLQEEILEANSSAQGSLVTFIKSKVVKKLQIRESKLLIVTDPYIFNFQSAEDCKYVKEILTAILDIASKLEKVVFILNPVEVNEGCKELIESFLREKGKEVRIVHWRGKAKFHDRFWLFLSTERHCKGFVIGTSLNGIGRKIALTAILSEDDSEELLRLLREHYRDILPAC